LFKGILKENIYFWLREGAKNSYIFTFWIKKHNHISFQIMIYFIFKKTNSETKFDNLQRMQFFFLLFRPLSRVFSLTNHFIIF